LQLFEVAAQLSRCITSHPDLRQILARREGKREHRCAARKQEQQSNRKEPDRENPYWPSPVGPGEDNGVRGLRRDAVVPASDADSDRRKRIRNRLLDRLISSKVLLNSRMPAHYLMGSFTESDA